jgi:hypothetical protein
MVETIALAALVVLGFLVAAASRHIQELYTCLDRMQEKLEHFGRPEIVRAAGLKTAVSAYDRNPTMTGSTPAMGADTGLPSNAAKTLPFSRKDRLEKAERNGPLTVG